MMPRLTGGDKGPVFSRVPGDNGEQGDPEMKQSDSCPMCGEISRVYKRFGFGGEAGFFRGSTG